MHSWKAKDLVGRDVDIKVDRMHADSCPICHRHIVPVELGAYLNGFGKASSELTKVFRCTNSRCTSLFLAIFKGYKENTFSADYSTYSFSIVTPGTPIPPDIPELVVKVSPRFAAAYEQASETEHYGLSEICGVGYRKALEFLVKDYLISKEEDESIAEIIAKKPLGACIAEHLSDPKTRAVASRATWLGNDETHYVRKWNDMNLDDLKRLLKLTINAIDNEITADSYIASMDQPK